MPGHVATSTQPGTAVPTKLRRYAQRGAGQLGDEQRQVNLIFRTEKEGKRPPPHVVTIEDVTKGLGLDDVERARIHKVIRQTRADFGQGPHLRVPRLPHARMQLMSVLRGMDSLDSTQRMEVARRAMVWWKKKVVTGMEAEPKIRYVVSKAQAKRRDLIKGKKKPTEDDDDDGIPNALDKDPKKKRSATGESRDEEMKGPDPQKAKGKDPKRQSEDKPEKVKGNPADPEQIEEEPDEDGKKDEPIDLDSVEHEEYDDGEDDDGKKKKGQRIKLHPKVVVELPEDADYPFHVTEHAKHLAQHKALKNTDEKRAEAHRHAANLHARIGNALHSAGETEKDHGKAKQPGPELEGAESASEGGKGFQPHADAEGDAGEGGGGYDVEGKPLPPKNDGKRNPPGRDSKVEAKQRAPLKGKAGPRFVIRKSHGTEPLLSLMLE